MKQPKGILVQGRLSHRYAVRAFDRYDTYVTHSNCIGARSAAIFRKTASARYPNIAYFRIMDETATRTTFVRAYRRKVGE